MLSALFDLCHEIRNWFETEKMFGEFTITDGSLDVEGLQSGQHFRVIGSVFNDGVYTYPATGMNDETFRGAVWAMAVPPAVIALSAEIEAWRSKYEDVNSAALSPFQAESFGTGGYSYSKGSGGSSGSGGASAPSWQSVFVSRLNQWRKL